MPSTRYIRIRESCRLRAPRPSSLPGPGGRGASPASVRGPIPGCPRRGASIAMCDAWPSDSRTVGRRLRPCWRSWVPGPLPHSGLPEIRPRDDRDGAWDVESLARCRERCTSYVCLADSIKIKLSQDLGAIRGHGINRCRQILPILRATSERSLAKANRAVWAPRAMPGKAMPICARWRQDTRFGGITGRRDFAQVLSIRSKTDLGGYTLSERSRNG